MRNVLKNSDEVMHYWANQVQASGKSGSVFFEGPSLYSYGRHYELGRIHPGAVLLNSKGYSVTTAKHASWARQATRHLPTFEVPNVADPLDPRNLTHLENNIAVWHENLLRARIVEGYDVQRITEAVTEYNAYAQTFEIAVRIEIDAETLELLNEFVVESNARKQAAKAAHLALQADPLAYAAHLAKLANDRLLAAERKHGFLMRTWREGGTRAYELRNLPCMLRVNTDEVQTSHGASVPLASAKLLAKALLNLPLDALRAQLPGQKIGHYEIKSVDALNVTIGCHVIPLTEVRKVLA